MPPPAERLALRVAGRGLTVSLVLLVAIPTYLTLAPAWRPFAARLCCALIVAAGSARLIRAVRGALDAQPPSALDAPPPPAPACTLDERFLRLRDELRFGARSRPYFDTILWPRLERLGAAVAPPGVRRRWRRDGPSPRVLAGVIADLEERA